jgi:hypothetical protein
VHTISSAQVPTEEASVAATDNGYVVHACSNKAHTGVKSRGWLGRLSEEKPFATEDVAGFPLQLWQIELDLAAPQVTVEPSTEPRRAYY